MYTTQVSKRHMSNTGEVFQNLSSENLKRMTAYIQKKNQSAVQIFISSEFWCPVNGVENTVHFAFHWYTSHVHVCYYILRSVCTGEKQKTKCGSGAYPPDGHRSCARHGASQSG